MLRIGVISGAKSRPNGLRGSRGKEGVGIAHEARMECGGRNRIMQDRGAHRGWKCSERNGIRRDARDRAGDGADAIVVSRSTSEAVDRRGGDEADVEILAESGDAAPALLSAAVKAGAEILVAGAFGHPRLQEFIFGGATRTLLNSERPSLFLSH